MNSLRNEMVSAKPPTTLKFNETDIENKLTILAIKAIKGKNSEKNIQQIQIFAKQQGITNDRVRDILSHNGFAVEDIKKIVNWNQGDPLSREEAEKMLENAPIGCWLLRYSPSEKNYVVTKKEGNCIYKHDNNLQKRINSVDTIIKGFSPDYHINDMLLSSNVLNDNIYTYGKLSGKEAEQMLENSPRGTWLLRYSDKAKDFVITVKIYDDSIIHLSLNLNKSHTLSEVLDQVEKRIAPKKNPIKLQHLGEISPKHRTHRQTEAMIMRLFVKELAGSSTDDDFIKISRKKYSKELLKSYVVEKQDQKLDIEGKPLFINKTLPDYAVKIYEVVHGKKGILGEGSYKIVKYIVDIETGKKLVKGKFKTLTPITLHKKFPEMLNILKMTKGMPHIASGRLVIMKSVKSKVNPIMIMSPFAESDLDKQIKDGKLSQETKMKYVRQLLTGLAALHDAKIAHRDIKPENINIIDGDAYLADFDLATCQNKPLQLGTPIFVAPEITQMKYKTIDDLLKGDVFGLGMSFFKLFNGHHLWYDKSLPDNTLNQLYKQFTNMTEKDWLKQFPEPSPQTIEHLVWQMMHQNPAKRLTPKAALAELDIIEALQKIESIQKKINAIEKTIAM